MSRRAKAFLVAALSARPLAAAARRAGHEVVALDLFHDVDTRRLACRGAAVGDGGFAFDPGALIEAAARLAPPASCAGLIYGAGFEDRPALLRGLAAERLLYGNPPETLSRLKNPVLFFKVLESLAIPHPETAVERPADTAGWLVKRVGGSGGGHVQPAADAPDAPLGSVFYQRRAEGRPCSALFLSDASRVKVLGISEQWTAEGGYRYAGAVSNAELPDATRARIGDACIAIARTFGLRGLNGIDFLVTERDFLLLEVNPRPTATLDLYGELYDKPLFDAHLEACRGCLPELPAPAARARAHQVVYAARPLRVPRDLAWPSWCSDIPPGGQHIAQGHPICTVSGEAVDASQARRLVGQLNQLVEKELLMETALEGSA